jgi:hypothetical protein
MRAVTAVIERSNGQVIWRDFGYEDTYEDQVLTNDYANVSPITFSEMQYDDALRRAALLITQVK